MRNAPTCISLVVLTIGSVMLWYSTVVVDPLLHVCGEILRTVFTGMSYYVPIKVVGNIIMIIILLLVFLLLYTYMYTIGKLPQAKTSHIHVDTDLCLQPCPSITPLTSLTQLDQFAGVFDSSLQPPHQVEPLPVLCVGCLLQLHAQSPGPLSTNKRNV